MLRYAARDMSVRMSTGCGLDRSKLILRNRGDTLLLSLQQSINVLRRHPLYTVMSSIATTEHEEEPANEWLSNSNECLFIELLRGDGTISEVMAPDITNNIFGPDGNIFGYQDLRMTLSFRAHDWQPKLHVKYGKQYEEQGEMRALDIALTLSRFMPKSTFDNEPLHPPEAGFKPPGQKIHGYVREGRAFETWCTSLADPLAKQILENMRILAPLYIDDRAPPIPAQGCTAERWKLFLLYEVDHEAAAKNSPHSLAAYAASYRSFALPEGECALYASAHFPGSQSIDYLLQAPSGESTAEGETGNVLCPLSDFATPVLK